eukprot:TRINITY_DN2166_c0_g1_i4.p2 TRINITY_DN2166_c0_g1~~TRINITY_DN2166_c0_g1_i4.p2  ORF type:complete len:102 (-),score=9.04 TRINITY_DN2166_c0_g1_i4:251-556(-)
MKNWLYDLFKVSEVTKATKLKSSMYKLLDPEGREIDRWFLRQDLLKVNPKNLLKELEDDEEFVVESILDRKTVGNSVRYLVHWYVTRLVGECSAELPEAGG